MFKKIITFALSLFVLVSIVSSVPVSAETHSEKVNRFVSESLAEDPDNPSLIGEIIFKDVQSFEFEETHFSDDPSAYFGRNVVESVAVTDEFETPTSDSEGYVTYAVHLLTTQASEVLEVYPESELIRVSIIDSDTYIPYAHATFYNVDGKLVISQATTSYTPALDPQQMNGKQLDDEDNPDIPKELLIKE